MMWPVISLLFLVGCFASELKPTVDIEQGTIRGTTLISSRNNQSYFAFMGIPYAKPPVGDLRFKPPEPVTPWIGILDTGKEGPSCRQYRYVTFHRSIIGSENCLFLNVYTPQLPSETEGKQMAVMVWIFGGYFTEGFGDRIVYGPDYLVNEGVILVTMNYRLGVLGFLSLQNEEVPGNNGLKDQVLALKWVKRNIEKFGGDPNKITIFGQSAGAACVHYHLLSPMSRGLFNYAISESGTVLNTWAYQTPKSNLKVAISLAAKYGRRTTNRSEILQRLKKADPRDFDEYIKRHTISLKLEPTIGPTLDTKASPGNVFLPDLPINMINSGNYFKIPYMCGMNSDEAIILSKGIKILVPFLLPVRLIAQFGLQYFVGKRIPNATHMADEVKAKYFGNSESFSLKYIDVLTDLLFGNGVYCTAMKQALNSTVYVYEFSFNGTANAGKILFGGSEYPGAAHIDDLAYLFNYAEINATIKHGTPELITSNRMVRMWTNFAKTGNPTPSSDSLLQNLTWPAVTPSNFQYLNIDKELSIKENFRNGIYLWWGQLFKKYIKGVSPCWTAH